LSCLVALVLAAGVAAGGEVGEQPPWERDPAELAAGEFLWFPEVAPAGPVTVVVSLPQQLARVYRNGVLIGISTVSTGRRGFETPTGVFQVLEKHRTHVSNLYDEAPMPYMVRLTWSGVALHAGQLPGHPASHGCVRLPLAFSQRLYEVTRLGTTVVISSETVEPRVALRAGQVLDPEAAAPPPAGGPPGHQARFTWTPEAAPEGPLSILLSSADRTVYVMRDGVEIGRSAVELTHPEEPLGASLFTLLADSAPAAGAESPQRPARRWMALPLNGRQAPAPVDGLARRIRVPRYFAHLVYDLLEPGTTLLVTDLPVASRRSKDGFMVLTTDETSTPAPRHSPARPQAAPRSDEPGGER
jgi:hypothetical protein